MQLEAATTSPRRSRASYPHGILTDGYNILPRFSLPLEKACMQADASLTNGFPMHRPLLLYETFLASSRLGRPNLVFVPAVARSHHHLQEFQNFLVSEGA